MNIHDSNMRFLNVMKDNKHTKSATEKFWRDRLSMQFGFDVWKLPVCRSCEGFAFWHKDEQGNAVGYCQCGTITKDPITVEQYYEQGHHVDRTLHADAPFIIDRKQAKGFDVAFGGEAGLEEQNKKIIIARG